MACTAPIITWQSRRVRPQPGRDPQEVVAAHVRRLEALRRAGIVERVAEGLWKVPDDLAERGRQYDAQRLGGVAVELKSHLPIERQARVIGATWLDQQLIGGGSGLGDLGFGGEAKQAMQQRADFLAEQGLAERRGQRVILARNLLGTLRNRELAQAAKDIAAETGLEHRPVADGQRVAGIYRRSVMLASGRYAMLDDGMGFSLVPWKPVIEQRLGQQIAATVRGGGVSWETRTILELIAEALPSIGATRRPCSRPVGFASLRGRSSTLRGTFGVFAADRFQPGKCEAVQV
jgi:hypothetical protein